MFKESAVRSFICSSSSIGNMKTLILAVTRVFVSLPFFSLFVWYFCLFVLFFRRERGVFGAIDTLEVFYTDHRNVHYLAYSGGSCNYRPIYESRKMHKSVF